MHILLSLELIYYRIMVHAYPRLLPNELESQTLGPFYYHRLKPRLQDTIPIVIYLACVNGWLTGTGHWVFETVKQILRPEYWKDYIYSQHYMRTVSFFPTILVIYIAWIPNTISGYLLSTY